MQPVPTSELVEGRVAGGAGKVRSVSRLLLTLRPALDGVC